MQLDMQPSNHNALRSCTGSRLEQKHLSFLESVEPNVICR
jgi:hypothetical protein